MSATDKLHRLLDERGVKYMANDSEYLKETCWVYMGELTASFVEYDNGTTHFEFDYWCFTPEQAVAATLGRGTCHVTKRTAGHFDGTRYNEWTFEFSCGHWYSGGSPLPPSFCCHCGRRIEVVS